MGSSRNVTLNQRERFIAGVLVTGYLALALLHIVNPDAYIARSNLLHPGATS